VRDFEAGVNMGSISMGDSEYLILAPFPDMYIFKSIEDSLVPVWYKNNINTNTILVQDFDKNGIREFLINDGQNIIGFEKNVSISPKPPSGFEVNPLDTNLVQLKWNQATGADRYIIYRGDSPENLIKIDSTVNETSFLDASVFNRHRYFYAIQTVDFSFESERSKLSLILSATPNDPPYIDTILVKNINQIQVYFSEPMDLRTIEAQNFNLGTVDNPTTSAISFLNGRAVLLSFSNQLYKGIDYQLNMVALKDTNNTPLPDKESTKEFIYFRDLLEKPYVSEWKFENNRSLLLTFSVPMNSNTVLNISNYTLEPSGSVEFVESLDPSERFYRLNLSRDTYGVNSGVTTYISFNNLESKEGTVYEEGNRIALLTGAENIEDMLVYPQPATIDDSWLMFSNIAEGTLIRIFDINGHFITKLQELDQNGGVRWNLLDDFGNKVSSGIYIYYATFDNHTKLGKFAIIK
jgi:hypothetical protein